MSTPGLLAELTPMFLRAVDALDDAAFAQPSTLPGWTRAHVIAHVHSNAEALRNLVSWARTGVESRMYASATARGEQIEAGARLSPRELRAMVQASASALDGELVAMTPEQQARVVVTAQGRSVPASEIVWMRCREVGVHAVDLAAGVGFSDLPAAFLEALIAEIVTKRCAGGEQASLAAWLTGRATDADQLGPWL